MNNANTPRDEGGLECNLTDIKFGSPCILSSKTESARPSNRQFPASKKNSTMFKKFTITDKLLFVAAFLTLIFSEITFFKGYKLEAIFVGIWVPSILGFGVYLKLIGRSNNE